MVINRSKIRRERSKVRKESLTNENRSMVCLFFDGGKDSPIQKNGRSKVEPNSQFLCHTQYRWSILSMIAMLILLI